ncbi:S26 family signal peptidase, partial [Rhizobium ruizarguesonis]
MSEKVETKPNALWENIKFIIQALILAMVIRTVLFQPFTIPSGSMMPTLLGGAILSVVLSRGFGRLRQWRQHQKRREVAINSS